MAFLERFKKAAMNVQGQEWRELMLFVVVISMSASAIQADLNLYLNESETRRILGVPGELYYVRDNIVNEYAVTYSVPISSSIDVIYFTWQNAQSTKHMWYNSTVMVSNEEAMEFPKTNLAREGIVPHTLSVFWVEMQCTGRVTDEVQIAIILHVALFNAPAPHKLNFRRRKMCFADEIEFEFDGGRNKERGGSDAIPADTEGERVKGGARWTASAVIFCIVVAALLGLVLVLVVAASLCRSVKRATYIPSDTSSLTHGARCPDTSSLVDAQRAVDTPKSSAAGAPGSSLSAHSQLTPQQLHAVMRGIHVDRTCVVLGESLMEGSFGKIYRGTLKLESKDSGENSMDVCVKTVTESVSDTQMQVFLTECCLLKGQVHENINPLIAVCLEQPPLLVFPHLNEGNLKRFLLRSKLSDRGTKQALSTQQLVYIAVQLVRGVEYLHKNRVVHRDIATRNCLVDSQLGVRLGDNALARDLFPADYHCLGDNENRPIKWLSIEALLDNDYSYASDVWAFGVTVWEVMTLALQPYADVDAFEMDTYLREGYRISQPLNCPDELFAVMACCWSLVPQERPHVSQLCACLQDFYSALCQFI